MYRQWSQVEYYIIIWTGFRFSNTDVTFFCATIHKTREDNSTTTTTTVRLCTCTLDNNHSSQYTLIIGTRPSPSFIHSLESVSHRISSHSRWWTYTTQHNTWPRRYELEGTPFTFHSLHQLMLRLGVVGIECLKGTPSTTLSLSLFGFIDQTSITQWQWLLLFVICPCRVLDGIMLESVKLPPQIRR